MAGVFIPPGKQRFVDPATGLPLIGGLLYHYIPATSTPKDTYSDQGETSKNTNPVVLDSQGECTIWGEGLFRQICKDSAGNQIWDQITGFAGSGGGTTVTFASPADVAAGVSTTEVISPYALNASGVLGGGGGGGTGFGATKPLSSYGTLSLDGVTVGSNDTILLAAEADASWGHFYTPVGSIRTNLTKDVLTKGYGGDAGFITGPGAGDGAYRPPRYSYMNSKPFTWPVQGEAGWFRGDQRFTDQGEWKIIGPNVRTYDTTARYYESNTMPHNGWLDTYSGNSGSQGYLTGGAASGSSTITINGPASLEWVGKTVAFAAVPGGAILETHVIDSILGNTFHITTPLINTYTWNAGAGQFPTCFFAPRTTAVFDYLKIRHAGGGDAYGSNIRMNVNYVPKASETHTFMAATGGQYGGDVYVNSDGVYMQFFESQLQGQSYDVAGIGFVSSLVRNVDTALDGGKFWAQSWSQSTGARPVDVGYGLAGNWRNGIDTVFASLYETSRLTSGASATNVLTVASVNGVHLNDTIIIGAETKTVQSIAGLNITLTTAIVGTYGVGTFVQFVKGGAVLNMALGQRIIFNSTMSANARSGDPNLVYPAFYGNQQGDLIMESGNDGSSDYWSIRFARGVVNTLPDSSRLRMRPTGMNLYGSAHTISGTLGLTAALNMVDGQILSLGGGRQIWSNGVNLLGSKDFGATSVILA